MFYSNLTIPILEANTYLRAPFAENKHVQLCPD
jgi:hypothetical protein